MAIIQTQYKNTNIEIFLNELGKVFEKHTTKLVDRFYHDIYNLTTAKDYGLDFWGKLLGFPRYIPIPDTSTELKYNYFNFFEKDFYKLQFFQRTDKFTYMKLTDDSYRIILKTLTLKLTQDCTYPRINEYCSYLFSHFGGDCFVQDSQNMQFTTYVFRFEIPEWLKFVINKYDLLPRPAGVGMKYTEAVAYYFGFEGQSHYYETGQRDITSFYKSIFYEPPDVTMKKIDLISNYKVEHGTVTV